MEWIAAGIGILAALALGAWWLRRDRDEDDEPPMSAYFDGGPQERWRKRE